MTYTVQPGDTLWSIAQKFELTLENSLAANPHITNPRSIQPGEVINIPTSTHALHVPGKLPRVREPYPEIRVERKNLEYARILSEDFAGRVSEVSAIMQYLHHHLEMEHIPNWSDVAELEAKISIVEMGHMEILGQTIVLLGGAPRYNNAEGKPWTPAYVAFHNFNPCAQLRADIQAEKDAIAQYKDHIEKINDRHIRRILQRIIRDEELHIILFSAQLAKLCG